MTLQSFVDKSGPVVSAAWLNVVDVIKYTIFADAATKAAARTALTSDAPLELTNGGTGNRTGAVDGAQLTTGTIPDARINPNLPVTTIELGHASDTTLSRSSAGVAAVEGSAILTNATGLKQGLITLPVMAGAMQPATTNGAGIAVVESVTNKVLYNVLDFDQATEEYAGFTVPFPKNWNKGTVTFQPLWTFSSGTGGVVWALQAVAFGNDETMDVAYGTEQTSSDVALQAGDLHVGPTSAAITIAGTPVENDLVAFRLKRVVGNGGDTLTGDARLVGLRLFFTLNASDDT